MANKILVVEDETVSMELIKSRLTANGYGVLTAGNGKEGLRVIKEEIPTLIITDVLMPEMDGFAFYKELKKNKATSEIPVLILTTRSKMEDSFQVMGVDGFLSKPINIDNLLSHVRKFIKDESPVASISPTPPIPEVPKAQPAAPAKKKEAASVAQKKSLIFGAQDSILESIAGELAKEKYESVVVKNDSQILSIVDKDIPDLIFLQFNATTQTPIDETIAALRSLLKKKFKLADKKDEEVENALRQKGIIILYKVAEEVSAAPGGTNLADTESLLQRCADNGCAKYIGLFSAISFLQKIKEFLNK